MANHHSAAALLIATLLVAVAIADASRLDRGYLVSDTTVVLPVLTCSKVHGVRPGETCFSVSQGVGLGLEQFLGFNPNINCQKVFVGQWVCLAATFA